jgi:anti-sigma-K factor RskA
MNEPVGWQSIEAWRNGTITDSDFESLQKLLRDQPDARRTLRRYMAMDSALRDHAEASMLAAAPQEADRPETPSPSGAAVATGSRFAWREAVAWSTAAAGLLLATAIWWKRPQAVQTQSSLAGLQSPLDIVRTDAPEPTIMALTIAGQREQLLASAPDVLHLQLVSDNGNGISEAGGDITWSSGRQIGFLRLRGLTENDPVGRQYQLWIVGSDVSGNEIINGGIFPVDQSSGDLIVPILAEQFVENPKMFVVDVEPFGTDRSPSTSLVAKADRRP